MALVGANVDEAGTGGVVDVTFSPKSVGKLRSWGVFGAAMGTGKAVDKESAKYAGSQGGWVTRRFNWKMRKIRRDIFKALHGRLAGRFKPSLARRCNDFASSRKKNCHRQKQPSRPGPRKKKKHRPVPSRRNKIKKPRRPASENPPRPVPPRKKENPAPSRLGKKTNAPSRFEKKTKTPRPAMNSKIHRPEGRNLKQIPPPVFFSFFLVAHLYRIVV